MFTIYENIKKLRLLNNWSQHELAKKVGYADKSMISRIESGKVDMQLSQILRFSKVFKITPGMLLGSTESNFIVSTQEQEIILAYRKSVRTTQRNLLKILDLDPVNK